MWRMTSSSCPTWPWTPVRTCTVSRSVSSLCTLVFIFVLYWQAHAWVICFVCMYNYANTLILHMECMYNIYIYNSTFGRPECQHKPFAHSKLTEYWMFSTLLTINTEAEKTQKQKQSLYMSARLSVALSSHLSRLSVKLSMLLLI